MVETYSLDDVGQGLDLADADDCVSVSLGRHSNDLMTSFYAHPVRLHGGVRLGRPRHRSRRLAAGRTARRSQPLGP